MDQHSHRFSLPAPLRGGLIGVSLISLSAAIPLIAVIGFVLTPTHGFWQHLIATVFWDYVANSLILCLLVGIFTVIIGTGGAWLITMCDFPLRRGLGWALVLPLAMPAYVLAYGYTDLLQATGPVQTWLREATGWRWNEYWFPNIRSVGGAVFVLSLALYPYVYITARAAFLEQSVCALEVSRTLGSGPFAMFRRVALPLARPAIISGCAFVLMETLADFGAVKFFEVSTFTTGIYRAWFADGNAAAASQLASLLLGLVFLILTVEHLSRGKARVTQSSGRYRPIQPFILKGWRRLGAMGFCALPVLLGFAIPAIALTGMAIDSGDSIDAGRTWNLTLHSLLIGAVAATITVLAALIASYGVRRSGGAIALIFARIASLGYATPGVVIAIGILIVLGAVDNVIDGAAQYLFGLSTGLLISGTLAAVLYGCFARFFATAYAPLEASLGRVKPSLDDAARTLGQTQGGVLKRIHLPMIKGSIFSAILLVFVDVMKELPATMILRPFNFDTLATEAFQLAATERLDNAATPALIIVLAGLIPVVILCRAIGRARTGQHVVIPQEAALP